MNFGKVEQANSELYDNELKQLESQLKDMIVHAKSMINACQLPVQSDETNYQINTIGQLIFPDYKNDTNYSQQFWKTYLKNQISFTMIKKLSQQTNQLQNTIKQIQLKQQNFFKLYKLKNRKKNRRLAIQIQKKFTCPYQKCYKIYGSDVSLNLHIKLKHNGGNKTDRQKLAQSICFAQLNNKPLPKMTLQLPPGYLDDYRKNQFKKIIDAGGIQPQEQPQNL